MTSSETATASSACFVSAAADATASSACTTPSCTSSSSLMMSPSLNDLRSAATSLRERESSVLSRRIRAACFSADAAERRTAVACKAASAPASASPRRRANAACATARSAATLKLLSPPEAPRGVGGALLLPISSLLFRGEEASVVLLLVHVAVAVGGLVRWPLLCFPPAGKGVST